LSLDNVVGNKVTEVISPNQSATGQVESKVDSKPAKDDGHPAELVKAGEGEMCRYFIASSSS